MSVFLYLESSALPVSVIAPLSESFLAASAATPFIPAPLRTAISTPERFELDALEPFVADAFLPPSPMTASVTPVSVSYTHLDVYKRQHYGAHGHRVHVRIPHLL